MYKLFKFLHPTEKGVEMSVKKIVLFVFIISSSFVSHTFAFSGQDVQRGAFGDDVIELQARLQ